MITVSATVPAAGSGQRMRCGRSKLFLEVEGETIIARTLTALAGVERIRELILVGREEDREALLAEARRALAARCERGPALELRWARGGELRRDSVLAGLEAADPAHALLLVHDAARPFVTPELVNRVIDAALLHGAALCALAAVDTIKHSRDGATVASTLERSELYHAQTPQIARRELLLPAYRAACAAGTPTTDDVSVLEQRGVPVHLVPGDPANRKITHPEDLPELRARAMNPPRIGMGFDLHRMESGRPCILGGVRIDHDKGPLGHSDGDALLHALTDALLGAAGLDDIGTLYPDTDPSLSGIDSVRMLAETMTRVRAAGYSVSNCDLVLVADRPRLAPHRAAIRARIAELLGVDPADVNVKGKSAEGLGPLGCGEAISAQAVVLLRER